MSGVIFERLSFGNAFMKYKYYFNFFGPVSYSILDL